jgi:mannitol-1-phosphate/altronate dehydrogenase
MVHKNCHNACWRHCASAWPAGLPCPALAMAIAGWMHFAVKVAHTPEAKLNDPLSQDILIQAKMSLQPNEIVHNLLSIQKIFGTDLINRTEGFVHELQQAPF